MYLIISKLQPGLSHRACDYLSMLGLKLNHVSKRSPRSQKWKYSFYIIEQYVQVLIIFVSA